MQCVPVFPTAKLLLTGNETWKKKGLTKVIHHIVLREIPLMRH